jgi:hypothetical protein
VTFAKAHGDASDTMRLQCAMDHAALAGVAAGDHVVLDGTIGPKTDDRVELTGCKLAKARPSRH